MPKLHLKRTPAEEAEHRWRKSQRARRKATKGSGSHSQTSSFDRHRSPSRKRQRTKSRDSDKIWDGLGYVSDEVEYGPHPPQVPRASTSGSSSPVPHAHKYKPDYDSIREEQRFMEKLSSAFEDDERLDSLEARLDDFAHVPDRWRRGDRGKGKGRMENEEVLDPQYLDDDEYAEWIRAGMWRKKHADEHAEQRRQKALKDARRAQENALKAETARLERVAEEERRRRKREREHQRWNEARVFYDARWKVLLGPTDDHEVKGFRFEDIPWPVIGSQRAVNKRGSSSKAVSISSEELTTEAISAFLFPPSTKSLSAELEKKEKKEKREKLRETILRFHPDKFEGRIMKRVRESHQDKVRLAVGQVTRALNTLMGEGT